MFEDLSDKLLFNQPVSVGSLPIMKSYKVYPSLGFRQYTTLPIT